MSPVTQGCKGNLPPPRLIMEPYYPAIAGGKAEFEMKPGSWRVMQAAPVFLFEIST